MRNNVVQVMVVLLCFCIGAGVVVYSNREELVEKKRENELDERLEAKYAFEAIRWYNHQRAYPTGTIPLGWKQKALRQIEANASSKTSSASQVIWTEKGPNNIGGRVRSLAIDPANVNVLYAGSVSGGVWKTIDAGSSWFATNDFASNLVISSIAIDPANSNIIYAGTGEGFFNVDALRGEGVLKSTNGGTSWALLTNFATPDASYGYNYITKILIRPGSPAILYASMLGGIWKSTDSGNSWLKLSLSRTYCTDLVVNPVHPDSMFAACGLLDNTDGIYRTTNGGTNWSKLSTGLPTAGYGRISLALAPSNPQIIYAVFDDAISHDTYNVYKSTNGGTNWAVVTKPVNPNPLGGSHLGGQGWYNNAIAVHPSDPNTVIIGGIDLFKTTNGLAPTASWSMISDGNYGFAPFVHVDQHTIVFNPSNPAIVYFGNDGGVYKSLNGGGSFSAINNNLSITQFYSCAVHPSAEIYYGGTQDNGTLKSPATLGWSTVFGGDGGVTAVDFTTPATVYTEYVFLDILKSFDSGSNWNRMMTGIPTSGGTLGDGTSDRCQFIAPYVMDPSNSQVLVAGTFKVYRTVSGANSWSAISTDLTGDGDGTGQVGSLKSSISAIAIAKTSSATIYIGTSGSSTIASRVQVTTNTGTSWANRSTGLPNRYVSSIAIDKNNASHAFVSFSGYGVGHIFMTMDHGISWTDVSGNFPNIPVNKILIDPVNTNHLFLGTDLGVFESKALGPPWTWTQQNTGLANVSVHDLDIRDDGFLFAATHGRGLFKTTFPVAVAQEEGGTFPSGFSLDQNYPNPFNPSTNISFTIAKKEYVRLTVFDAIGREVARLVDQELEPGSFTSTFDASNVSSGIYFYTLKAGNYTFTKKMVLIR